MLDADETVISNMQYQIERAQARLTFTPESWRAWIGRREATPIPGAGAFLARVRDLGGRIAIVTNRLESECADTEAVFKTHRLAYDMMLCRPDTGPSDKNPRFAAVTAGTTKVGGPPLDAVMFVGDNILDFPNLSQAAVKNGRRDTRAVRDEILHAAQPDVRQLAIAMSRPSISVFPKCYFDELVAGRRNYVAWIHDAATLGSEGIEHYDEFFPSYDERDVAPVMDAMAATGQVSSMMCFSPDFTHPDKDERARQVERQKRAIDLTVRTGARPLPHAQRPEVSGAVDNRGRGPRRRVHLARRSSTR